MKVQPVLIALSALNLCGLTYLVSQSEAFAAPTAAAMLRGRGLEIVDPAGRVRASISLMPAQTLKDGSVYPETVLLRLINGKGRPNVKISAMEDGSAMSLASEGPAYAQILARTDKPELNLVAADGKRMTP
jgi:hypothetical protein